MNTLEHPANGHAVTAVKPEWLRLPDATRASGIGRSSLYELVKENKIKSVCLKNRNSTRGIRLINADSLSKFIESFASAGSPEKATANSSRELVPA